LLKTKKYTNFIKPVVIIIYIEWASSKIIDRLLKKCVIATPMHWQRVGQNTLLAESVYKVTI